MRGKNFIVVVFFLCAQFLCAQTASFSVSAGPNKNICQGASCTIGGSPTAKNGIAPYNYTWAPALSLNYSDSANPVATPTTTTVYTVTVRDKTGATKSSTVTVNVFTYTINAGADTTIKQGQTIVLHGQAPGDSIVWWGGSNNNTIFNPSTLNPDVFAQITGNDTLLLIAVFPHGCTLYDKLIITVLSESQLYFFNSFSPNHDGVNENFVIGNIEKYPNNTLEVYNRYGQKVFSETDYQNDWNGSYLGDELPAGTYFYILDTHDAIGGKYHGEINIIK